MKTFRNLMLACALLLLVPISAHGAVQWTMPISLVKAKKFAKTVAKAEHPTFGGVKIFTVSRCAFKGNGVRCVVASRLGSGAGMTRESVVITFAFAKGDDGEITIIDATVKHTPTRCPTIGTEECVAYTTWQRWNWSARKSSYVHDELYVPDL